MFPRQRSRQPQVEALCFRRKCWFQPSTSMSVVYYNIMRMIICLVPLVRHFLCNDSNNQFIAWISWLAWLAHAAMLILQLEERRKGNKAYKAGRFQDAKNSYLRALSIVNYVRGRNASDQCEIDRNKVWSDGTIACSVSSWQPSAQHGISTPAKQLFMHDYSFSVLCTSHHITCGE